ncbi:hypothetical protein [Curtobacterium sp. MCBD17_030]|uniref:hypothetical protein n=1 Tax=Curtobacterium sp. MCBD17_030 TaxID=2175649 RepID=UPI0015E8C23A|nr:hypothetical protein [Curtobacterium sp. MCBD17_030]
MTSAITPHDLRTEDPRVAALKASTRAAAAATISRHLDGDCDDLMKMLKLEEVAA